MLGLTALLLTQPLAVWRLIGMDVVPAVTEPASYLAFVPAVVVGAASVLLVVSVTALGNRTDGARGTLSAPLVAAVVGAAILSAGGHDLVSFSVVAVPVSAGFLLSGGVVGGAVAPVALGALEEDTLALLAGAVVLLAGITGSPVPALTAVAGLFGGTGAVGVLWTVDVDGWRP